MPPATQQRAIGDFLDRKTAQIDRLIERKERLIELLEEKRAALITRAVTKGLDPDVEMKDSGVEWLGEIPAHWGCVPLGRLVQGAGGGTPDRNERRYWSGEIPWVSPKDMKVREVEGSQEWISGEAVAETGLKLIQPPAVLLVVRGMILDHTLPAAVTKVPVTINQDMKAFMPRVGLRAEFLSFALQGLSQALLGRVDRAAHGTCKLEAESWQGFPIPVPPDEEQGAIWTYLQAKTRELDQVAESVHRATDLLHEYRTALISAAVTGKIDVREEAA